MLGGFRGSITAVEGLTMGQTQESTPSSQFQPQLDSIRLDYEQTCDWYHKIDDFRAKLLGFLPFISGAGNFSCSRRMHLPRSPIPRVQFLNYSVS
jgi:hypothetical protein